LSEELSPTHYAGALTVANAIKVEEKK